MCVNCLDDSCESCNPVVIERGPIGPQGIQGKQGIQGFNGWSPMLGLIQNDGTNTGTGNFYALQFVSWIGGSGTSPATPTPPNIYMQANGTFGALSTAVNLRGAMGYYTHWLGTFSTAPSTPNLLDAYRDSTLRMSRIWDGSAWREMNEDGLAGTGGTPGISANYIGDVTSFPSSPTLNQVVRLTTATPITAYWWNGTSWVTAWKDGFNGSNGTNGTNGTNGFNYETLDGNGIPAVATGPYQVLRRNSANTGYEFVSPLQLKVILNQTR